MRTRYPLPLLALMLSIIVPGILLPPAIASGSALLAGGAGRDAAIGAFWPNVVVATAAAILTYVGAVRFYVPLHNIGSRVEARGGKLSGSVAKLSGPVIALVFETRNGEIHVQQVGLGLYAISHKRNTILIHAGESLAERVDKALGELGIG